MKRYMLSILPLFLTLCLMAGCGGRSGMHSRLAAVDSIVDSRYDSALTVLRGMDTLQMRRSDRMYLELLRAKAMNKASVPFTSDSVMRRVARYYDRHGSSNQRLQAHYLLGCVYRDLRSAPRALEEYQRAVSQADTTRADCDLPTLMRVHAQMADLFMSMHLYNNAENEMMRAETICWQIGDTLSALIFKEKGCNALSNAGNHRACAEKASELYEAYVRYGYASEAPLVCVFHVKSYLALGENGKAREYLSIMKNDSSINADPRKLKGGKGILDIYLGQYYLNTNDIDSAEIAYRHAFPYIGLKNNALLIYEGMLRIHEKKKNADSIAKYAVLYTKEKELRYHEATRQVIQDMKAVYDYGVEQKIAKEQTEKTAMWKNIAFALSSLAIILLYYFMQKKAHVHRLVCDLKSRLEEIAALKEREHESSINAEQLRHQILYLNGQISYLCDKLKLGDSEKFLLEETEIVKRFRRAVTDKKVPPINKQDWKELFQVVNSRCPAFLPLISGGKKLSLKERRLCLLVLCNIEPNSADILLDARHSYASKTRARLHEKIFGKPGSTTSFDIKLRSLLQ